MKMPQGSIPPKGQRGGIVLPPQSNYGEWAPSADNAVRDGKLEIIPEGEWKHYIGKVEKRHLVKHIYSQRNVGSCAAEAVSGILGFLREAASLPHVQFNPYSVYRITSGGYDNGSSLDANLKQYRDVGVLAESYFPRWGPKANKWNAKPPRDWKEHTKPYRIDEWWYVRDKLQFGSCLLAGHPVYFGYPGHAIWAIALVDPDTILYVNSWDKDWGDGGMGTVKWRSIEWGYGCYAVRTPVYGG